MQELLRSHHDLIEGIAAAMDARDPSTESHSLRVACVTQRICRLLLLSVSETETVHIAAHVHDIGKIGIPDTILLKTGALTESEWERMKSHPEIGCRILEKVEGFGEIAEIVRHHHERWDGKGYPDGLRAGEIPLGSRIIALADSIDAMLSDRRYRIAMTPDRCRREIAGMSGVQYDPWITKLVIKHWASIVDAAYTENVAGDQS